MAFTAVRQRVTEAVESFRALSGYSLLTGLGILLGFAREVTVASTFGLSPQLDVFIAVMSVQMFFGTQVGNALETAFIARVGAQNGPSTVLPLLMPAVYGLLLVNAGVVLFLWGSGSLLLEQLFPRFDLTQQAVATHTLHALLLPLVLANTAGLIRGALVVLGAFVPGFLAGSIVSVCIIVSIMMFSSSLGIDALTLGVAVGNLGVLGLFVGRLVLLTGGAGLAFLDVWSVASRSGWFVLWGAAATVLLGELVYAGVTLTERSLASWLPPGSIAGFFYASTIVSVPLALFIIPLTTMVFPGMVEAFRRDTRAGLAQIIRHGMFLLVASVAVVLVVVPFAQTIVETVFLRGQFSTEHAAFTASILSVTIMALPFMSLSRLLRNACYALSDYRTPVAGLVIQMATLAGLGLVLVPRYGAPGLAGAMVAGEAVLVGTMALVLVRRVRMQ
jgi:peptidoglycan biosynthesis protein MviN/MurJ (putative lipid II flippase)